MLHQLILYEETGNPRTFVVRIQKGTDPDTIAQSLGFINKGKATTFLEDWYIFEDLEEKYQSARDVEDITNIAAISHKLLQEHPNIKEAYKNEMVDHLICNVITY